MDRLGSIDTISEISSLEASSVPVSTSRSGFEQQLCTQLLSLSQIAETLADRVLVLEQRLAAVEGEQDAGREMDAVDDEADSLLCASEDKVRMLIDRLGSDSVVAFVPPSTGQDSVANSSTDEAVVKDAKIGNEAVPADLEVVDSEDVDDPQIDLLTA